MPRFVPYFLMLFLCFGVITNSDADTGNNSEDTATAENPSESDTVSTKTNVKPDQAFSQWGGEGSLGWIASRGNTDNKSLNADLKIKFKIKSWLHNFSVKTKKISEEETVTAERYLYTQQARLRFSKKTYIFEALRYDDDRFDGFEYQSSVTVGVGWYLIDSDRQNFDLEFGAGSRRTRLETGDESSSENVGRISQHYDVKLTETSELIEDLLIETGESNTLSELTTAFKVSINKKLALKLSYNVKHNSDPQPGNKKTDRTTSANLVYGF